MSPRQVGTKEKPKKRSKRPVKRPEPIQVEEPGPLVPQQHGGSIYQGTPATIVPGPGRPKDEVRAAFLGVSAKGAAFLDQLMDGKVEFDFVGLCPHCGETSEPPLPKDLVAALVGQVNRSIDYRLRTTETAAKFGLGTKDEVTLTPSEFERQAHAALQIVTEEVTDGVARGSTASEIMENIYRRIAALTGGRRDG